MRKLCLGITLLLLITGCSNKQASTAGMRSTSVNSYAQNMSNMELCETLYYGRATTQTKAAIGVEFNKRRLTRRWCDNENEKWYAEEFLEWLTKHDAK